MREGRFGDDLYFRLNVFLMQLRPLHQRAQKSPLTLALVLHIVAFSNTIPTCLRSRAKYHPSSTLD